MKCIDCNLDIPSNPGVRFYGTINEGVRCEDCAVKNYKKEHPFTWDLRIPNKGIVNLDCKS